ncbi:UNVERIFIED_ORG: putative membrane protein YfcA [Rhizobium esperanzae]
MTLDALITDGQAWFAAALLDHGIYALMAFAFIAGLARGFSGFGAALIFIPLGGAIIGPNWPRRSCSSSTALPRSG